MTTAVEIFCPACGHTWDADCYLHEDDVDTLLARHNALVEAVREYMRADDAWYRAFQRGEPDEIIFQGNQAEDARAEVDRLIAEVEG